MTYDLIDANDDGVVDADVDNQSVSTESAVIGSAYRNPKPEDGTAGIQAAIDALPSSGGVVHLQNGRYEVNNTDGDPYNNPPIVINKPNLTIVGEGWESEIFLPENSTDAASGGGEGSQIIHTYDDYDGTVLKHFAVNGNQQNNGGTGDGDNITDATDGHNIRLKGSGNRVFGIKSVNSTGDGIEMRQVEDRADQTPKRSFRNVVVGNYFENNYEQDLHNWASETLYLGNTCYNEKTNSAIWNFNDSSLVQNTAFVGNVLVGSGSYGVGLHSTDGPGTRNLLFANNIVANHALSGVYFEGDAEGVTIRDNVCVGNGQQGIRGRGATNATIQGNTIRQNDLQGIYVEQRSSGEDIDGLFIENNFVNNNNQADNNKAGIHLKIATDNLDFKNIRITDNTVLSQTPPTHRQGILIVQSGTPATIEDLYAERNWIKGLSTTNYINDQTGEVYLHENEPWSANAVDSLPSHEVGKPVLASATADPDGDGNGEWVMSDGVNWQEIVDLPNLT